VLVPPRKLGLERVTKLLVQRQPGRPEPSQLAASL